MYLLCRYHKYLSQAMVKNGFMQFGVRDLCNVSMYLAIYSAAL